MSIDENILQRLRNIATPTLANALDDIGFNGVMNNLHPAGLGMKIVGRAVTVQEITGPYGSFSNEDFKVGHMIDAACPGDVIVERCIWWSSRSTGRSRSTGSLEEERI